MNKQNDEEILSGTRILWGILFLILAVFIFLSLLSYDWTDVGLLKARQPQVPHNLIGPVGAWLAFGLLLLFGLGAYVVPVGLVLAGLLLLLNRQPRLRLRLLWLGIVLVAVVLLQEFLAETWAPICDRLNLGPYPSGRIGHWIMRDGLIRWFKPVGAGILVCSVLLVALVLCLGLHTVRRISRTVGDGIRSIRRSRSTGDMPEPKPTLSRDHGWERRLRAFQQIPERPSPEPTCVIPPDTPKPENEARAPHGTVASQTEPSHVTPRKVWVEDEGSTSPVPPEPHPGAASPRPTVPEPVAAKEPSRPSVPPVSTTPPIPRMYTLPSLDVLNPLPPSAERGIVADSEITAKIIVETLKEFGIESDVVGVEKGPTVTRYDLLPAPGVRVEKISALSNNLALSLKATSVRVQAPVPGKGVVGIEVPNLMATVVYLREIVEGDEWKAGRAKLPLILGKDVAGKDLITDLTEMPHLLIAGATGSGKTICLNAILAGLLMSRCPDDLRLMLVDPKIVEFSAYNGLPHLIVPVITNPRKVGLGLRWAIQEMERRYRLFARVGVRNIDGFNHRPIARPPPDHAPAAKEEDAIPEKVPYIVIVIDELADLMLTDQAEIENAIARLAQLSRAVGIHMILSTQRPSVNVITGTIKANFPARIAFQVAQKVDSRTILDTIGADKLLGRGDMLFLPPGVSKLVRAQGAWVRDEEILRITEFWRTQGAPEYEIDIANTLERGGDLPDDAVDEELIEQAVAIIRETRRASTSSLQRRLRIGYTRAARIMDVLEQRGLVGPPRGSDPREILIDLDAVASDTENTTA